MTGRKRYECRYCKRPFYATPEGHAENPWCRSCIHERLIVAGIVSWLRAGPPFADRHAVADSIERGEWRPKR